MLLATVLEISSVDAYRGKRPWPLTLLPVGDVVGQGQSKNKIGFDVNSANFDDVPIDPVHQTPIGTFREPR